MNWIRIIIILFISGGAQLGIAQEVKSYSTEYNGIKLGKDSSKVFFVVNGNGAVISTIDEVGIDTEKVITEIRKSDLPDRELIARVLELNHDEKSRIEELMNLTVSYNEIAIIVLQSVDLELRANYSKRQLKKMKKRNPGRSKAK